MTVNHPLGGEPVEAWELRAGDYIKVRDDDGTMVTAHVIQIDRGPDHKPGTEGVDWECVYRLPGQAGMPHGHAEIGVHDVVTRVWASGVAA